MQTCGVQLCCRQAKHGDMVEVCASCAKLANKERRRQQQQCVDRRVFLQDLVGVQVFKDNIPQRDFARVLGQANAHLKHAKPGEHSQRIAQKWCYKLDGVLAKWAARIHCSKDDLFIAMTVHVHVYDSKDNKEVAQNLFRTRKLFSGAARSVDFGQVTAVNTQLLHVRSILTPNHPSYSQKRIETSMRTHGERVKIVTPEAYKIQRFEGACGVAYCIIGDETQDDGGVILKCPAARSVPLLDLFRQYSLADIIDEVPLKESGRDDDEEDGTASALDMASRYTSALGRGNVNVEHVIVDYVPIIPTPIFPLTTGKCSYPFHVPCARLNHTHTHTLLMTHFSPQDKTSSGK